MRFPLAAVLATPALLVLAGTQSEAVFGLAMASALPLVILSPFAIYTREALGSPDRLRTLRLRWPGFAALVTVAIVVLVSAAVESGTCLLADSESLVGSTLGLGVGFILETIATPAVAATMVFKIPPTSVTRLARYFRSRDLGPFVAVQARWAYLVLVLLGPIALIYLYMWRHIPTAAEWLQSRGSGFPFPAGLLIQSANFAGRFGAFIVVPLVAVATCLVDGRLVWLTYEAELPRELPTACPPRASR
jgi:hypothetical protein